MAAYLIVDVDDLLEHFRRRSVSIDLQELAVGLRGGAALAAGLFSPEKLKAVAVANWGVNRQQKRSTTDPQYVFKAAGYDTFDVPLRTSLADALIQHYFSFDPDPVDELILATTNRDLMPLVRRVHTTRKSRIRMWGVEDVLKGTEFADDVIFQPLETLLGIQQTKNVAVYIDFENIAISLNEQGFTVNLDFLVDSFVRQAQAHGQILKIAAYAPWGQRGSLPPLVDSSGREVADEAPSRLAMANIDPVFNLPGKNSADMKIAKDVITDAGHADAADVYVVASGDRDFNEVINSLRSRNKQVILWAVRGSTSRQLENNANATIEYVEDFTNLQTHQMLSASAVAMGDEAESLTGFTPSQWTSVIVQFDHVARELGTEVLSKQQLIQRLCDVGAVVSPARGEDLINQAIELGLLQRVGRSQNVIVDEYHPVVEKTRLIRERIVVRVMNTLNVRGWEYVNYGFLLKGLAMDRELERPGLNYSDQWRSDWIDCLVRERVLMRELVPHRHNPDDLVPVIKLRPDYLTEPVTPSVEPFIEEESLSEAQWQGISIDELEHIDPETSDMVRRVIVSVEQFTSFRGFTWCPLGSLHKRLRPFDRATGFQRSVEFMQENQAADVREYLNPQSEFYTKGISLAMATEMVQQVVNERDVFIKLLLQLYERNMIISEQTLRMMDPNRKWDFTLWFSIMETENVLNPIPGRGGQYSLFRTHHTVTLVADAQRNERFGRAD